MFLKSALKGTLINLTIFFKYVLLLLTILREQLNHKWKTHVTCRIEKLPTKTTVRRTDVIY